MNALGVGGWEQANWVRAREDAEARPSVGPEKNEVRTRTFELGSVRCSEVIPLAQPVERTLIYLPGGGYTQGSWASHGELASRLAVKARARLVMFHYRLAPEHPFPAALDDVLAAWKALLSDGTDPRSCILCGDSAGGGLAVSSLLALRDRGLALPRASLLFSPWVDLSVSGASVVLNARLDWYPVDCLRAQAGCYLAGLDAEDVRVAPLRADLRDLPPFFVQVGSAEILLDDSRRLAAALVSAGVSVELDEWSGLIHGWQFYPELLTEARAAVERAAAFAVRST